VDPFFAWLEGSALSVWVRESDSWFAFPGILTAHAIGLAFAAGTAAAIDLRVLGILPRVPAAAMARFVPVIWIALIVNVVSGVLLLVGYPTKALTNPVFAVKIACVVAGVWLLLAINDRIAEPPFGVGDPAVRRMALASLAVWFGAIVSGRLLAYTCTRLTVDFGSCF
jgi:hypothetical protein